MGVFSSPFKTMARKINSLFNPRDRALLKAKESNVLNKAMAEKDKRTTSHFHFKKRSQVSDPGSLKTFGSFSPVLPFRSGRGTHKRTPSISLQ